MTTTIAISVYKAALTKINECRSKCPGVGGDIAASNLRYLIENRLIKKTTAIQAADTLESLSRGLEIDASDEIDALRQIEE
jgi:hypothetical protein